MPAPRFRRVLGVLVLTFAAHLTACGGSGGGSASQGGLILASFEQGGQDNVPLNRILEFRFSSAVDPASIYVIDAQGQQRGTGAIQIREGSAFGLTVPGRFEVDGTFVFFKPQIPGLCDLSDTGLEPDTQYRVSVIGFPEALAVRAVNGAPLDATTTAEFHTRPDGDPSSPMFEDQDPGRTPSVLFTEPANGDAAVAVHRDEVATTAYEGNEVRIRVSEGLDPCSVNSNTVRVHEYARGNPLVFDPAPNGRSSGFQPATDSDPDPYDWGSGTPLPVPALVVCDIQLVQDYERTEIVLRPQFTEWPDDALIVVELTFEIADFGGQPLTSTVIAFTTENRPVQTSCRRIEFLGETPIDTGASTADVDSARSPGLAQAFLLFSGDGDNGANPFAPSEPGTPVSGCSFPRQTNDGTKDDFNPAADVILDTGSTANTCPNGVDGSTAVVWEFRSFRIPSNVTVRVIGVNPAIFLVQTDVQIDTGGRLLVRGDGIGGAPQGRGANSPGGTVTTGTTGGTGVAGGGRGGSCLGGSGTGTARYSGPGAQGYYMLGGGVAPDVGAAPGTGGGHGNTSAYWQQQIPNNRNTPSGGGGGHATAGVDGTALGTGTAPTRLDNTPDGLGGQAYGATSGRMLTPEAGSGGGAGAELRPFTGNVGRGPGGAGGAGGGFLDLTAGGDIVIHGTVDAAGSAGGNGATQPFNPNYTYEPGTGGGGGGSGGGLRIMTPRAIVLGPGTVLTAAGGAGGVGGDSQNGGPARNHGGTGAAGRIVLEDGDSTITGLESAVVTPGEGFTGFTRGLFDPLRFSGGGLTPTAVTLPFHAGPASPAYVAPSANHLVAGIPQIAARGPGSTAILLEAQAFPLLEDGSFDPLAGSGWFTVGYFTDSGIDTEPNWVPDASPGDVTLPSDNAGTGVGNLSGRPWIQVRITFYLPTTMGPLDPGPYVDRWDLCFQYDQ